jgi:hypothetical protein
LGEQPTGSPHAERGLCPPDETITIEEVTRDPYPIYRPRSANGPRTDILAGYQGLPRNANITSFVVLELAMTADTSFSLLTGNSIETRRVRAGGVIFREGEQADELFVIKSGYVRIRAGRVKLEVAGPRSK